MNEIITQEILKHVLDYSEETGVFKWKTRISNRIQIGDIAGNLDKDGYIQIRIHGVIYRAHRLVWLYLYGRWPKDQIDHINMIRKDNRISNLREASRTQNFMNKTKLKNNTSGFKGVFWNTQKNKWSAKIIVNKKQIHLGSFLNSEDASAAYKIAAIKYHGEFANYGK